MIDMTSQMMYRVGNLNIENERVSYQMSTGEKLQNGSDDSLLYSRVLDIEDSMRVYDGLKTQIDKTQAQNNVSDSSMGEIKKIIDSIKVDLLKALNTGMDAGSRSAIGVNIAGLRENLLTISNTQVDGEYIYAGSDTTKQSFIKDPDYESNGKVTFGGNAVLRKVAVEPGTYRERGVSGYDVLMYNSSVAGDGTQLTFNAAERVIDENSQEWKLNATSDKLQQYDKLGVLMDPAVEINVTSDGATPPTYTTNAGEITGIMFLEAKHNYFDDLNIIINALNGYSTNTDGTKNERISDVEINKILSPMLEKTSAQYESANIGHAELGGRNNIFNISLERIDAKIVHYNILMQEVGGADMSKLAMESKSLEMIYQALYSTISKMNSLSLLNFLK